MIGKLTVNNSSRRSPSFKMFQAELPGCKVGRQIFGSFKSFQLKHKAGDLPNFIGIAFELQMQELLLVKFYFSAYSDEEFDMIR